MSNLKTKMFSLAAAAGLCAAASAYAVRGRSSQVFGPSVHKGPGHRKAIALTFDDGPSEGTPQLLDLLSEFNVTATFFVCGQNVERLPFIARRIVARGHEIGNHSYTHPRLYGQSSAFVEREFEQAQQVIEAETGISPWIMRAPYGARWFGLRSVQSRLGLLGVMWTVIGCDWSLPSDRIATRVLRSARPGAIVCLHDGRETQPRPNITNTLTAVREIIVKLQDQGYEFEIVSDILQSDRDAKLRKHKSIIA